MQSLEHFGAFMLILYLFQECFIFLGIIYLVRSLIDWDLIRACRNIVCLILDLSLSAFLAGHPNNIDVSHSCMNEFYL